MTTVDMHGLAVTVESCDTVVVGSGAAGLNCAVHLHDFGVRDVMVVTEGMNRGTSRNTGSDKQTYYKLGLAGDGADSVRAMARSLYDGGAMDGDIALAEAALSWLEFAHLVHIGVPFPHNEWGEFPGYRTDHDATQRATSAGPLTSRLMTERLEDEVSRRGIRVVDRTRVVQLLVRNLPGGPAVCGCLGLQRAGELPGPADPVLFRCRNIVYATGGPAGLFGRSVYPKSQGGATGTALLAGVHGKNLTEWQFGLASLKFRWNLSGTYQQVLPAYVSTDAAGGDEQPFLAAYFPSMAAMLNAQFLKGYQWPFTPAHLAGHGSSLVDLAVHHETVTRGRRVWIDYRRNPWGPEGFGAFSLDGLSPEALVYLQRSGADAATPLRRLEQMNRPACELYCEHGIDLAAEMLEIGVCAQHHNGGLEGDLWWESNLRGFFPVGEANGSHGVCRPGGAALNAGQTGGYRAAERISRRPRTGDDLAPVEVCAALAAPFVARTRSSADHTGFEPDTEMAVLRERMDRAGGIIRSAASASEAAAAARAHYLRIRDAAVMPADAMKYAILVDHLAAQTACFEAIAAAIAAGGVSRGSCLVLDPAGTVPAPGLEAYAFRAGADPLRDQVGLLTLDAGLATECTWRPVRPIPEGELWFETVWRDFREGKSF
ncbi:MAG: FAD-binding protein [Planctomycetota bacterium]